MDNPTVTVTELSGYLDISPRQIQMYVSQGVLPKKSKGRYDLIACVGAFIDHKLIGPGSPLAKSCPKEAAKAFYEYYCEHVFFLRGEVAELAVQNTELEAQIGSRTCQVCGASLEAKRNDARYCSGKCRATAHRVRIRQ